MRSNPNPHSNLVKTNTAELSNHPSQSTFTEAGITTETTPLCENPLSPIRWNQENAQK
jgi:hypothetical protein